MVLTNMLPNQGNGTFDLHAYAVDDAGLQTLLGTRRIVAANATSTQAVRHDRHAGSGRDRLGHDRQFRLGAHAAAADHSDQRQHHRRVHRRRLRGPSGLQQQSRRHRGAVPRAARTPTARSVTSCSIRRTLANGLHTIQWVVRDNAGQTSRASGAGSSACRTDREGVMDRQGEGAMESSAKTVERNPEAHRGTAGERRRVAVATRAARAGRARRGRARGGAGAQPRRPRGRSRSMTGEMRLLRRATVRRHDRGRRRG